MDWFATAFVKASLVWLGLGVTLGVCMAAHPAWTIYRPAHEHMNLLGFVTMMIFGVGYHVLPRFVGGRLFSKTLGAWHWWLANIGLLGMVSGFALRPHEATVTAGTIVLATGGTLAAAGVYLFIFNIWKTLDAARGRGVVQTVADRVQLERRSAGSGG
jgi:cbb3-type cytochrome oxidase subunit 1